MAHITTSGFSDFLKDLEALGDDADAMAADMLEAGAEVAVVEWKKGIQNEQHKIAAKDGKGFIDKRGYIDTGDMVNSVGRILKKERSAEIYPQGIDHKGIRNAEKAFVLHYGTSHYQGSRFVDDIDDKTAPEAVVAMGKVMDEYIEKHGL